MMKGIAIEHGVVARSIDHGQQPAQQLAAEFGLVEREVIAGALDQGAAGGDQRSIQPEHLHQRQRPAITTPGGQHDLDAGFARPPDAPRGARRQLIAAVDQRSINVDSKQAVHEGKGLGIRG